MARFFPRSSHGLRARRRVSSAACMGMAKKLDGVQPRERHRFFAEFQGHQKKLFPPKMFGRRTRGSSVAGGFEKDACLGLEVERALHFGAQAEPELSKLSFG